MTLVFIGDIKPAELSRMQVNLNSLTGLPAFTLSAKVFSQFPDAKSPILACEFWQDVELSNAVKQLTESIDLNLENQHFRPHITLARQLNKHRQKSETVQSPVPNAVENDLKKVFNETFAENHQWVARKACLYQSYPSSAGSEYTIIDTAHLKQI